MCAAVLIPIMIVKRTLFALLGHIAPPDKALFSTTNQSVEAAATKSWRIELCLARRMLAFQYYVS